MYSYSCGIVCVAEGQKTARKPLWKGESHEHHGNHKCKTADSRKAPTGTLLPGIQRFRRSASFLCSTDTVLRNDGRLPQYYVENSNPPIVSRETYKAVQALMQSRKTESCKRRVYPLTGKLRCPECGRVFRHQVVNGMAYWLCAGRSSGITDCQNRRVREDAVYTAFTDMVIKLKAYRAELLGTLIRQAEVMQSRTSRNRECIRQIDKELADLGAKNLVITRLHTGGALNAAEYAKQTSTLGNRITELRIERRKKLTEDEDDVLLDSLRELDGILGEYEPTAEFDGELFAQIVESITVDSAVQLNFRLIGGIALTEQIPGKGRLEWE